MCIRDRNKIATFTGGRAAEEIVFGEITTGASTDCLLYTSLVLTNKASELSNCQKEKMIEAYEKIISNIQEDDLAVTQWTLSLIHIFAKISGRLFLFCISDGFFGL